jgi:hypothetical protein
MRDFETIEESELDQVAGGLSFSLGFDTETGLTAETPLGSISVPSPIRVATELVGGLTGSLGEFLTRFGGRLSQLGQIFNFS